MGDLMPSTVSTPHSKCQVNRTRFFWDMDFQNLAYFLHFFLYYYYYRTGSHITKYICQCINLTSKWNSITVHHVSNNWSIYSCEIGFVAKSGQWNELMVCGAIGTQYQRCYITKSHNRYFHSCEVQWLDLKSIWEL